MKKLNIDLDGFKIAALRATNSPENNNNHKILCVHGWLDNANSFLPLLPLIDNADIVAIDLPGHGHSDHEDSMYSLAGQSHKLLTVADALGWDNFTLTGHSLGGCIAPFSAVAADTRVSQLILIEAVGPLAEPPADLPKRLKKFRSDLQQPDKYQPRLFDSIDQAIASRLHANKMNQSSAKLIVERQLKQLDHKDGPRWQWRFDKKLRQTSPSYFTEEQVRAVLEDINCPTLCILADQGYLTSRTETTHRLNCIKNREVVELPGFHHLHLDTPEPVANAINSFLKNHPPTHPS